MLGEFRVYTLTRYVWFMQFEVEMAENGRRKLFRKEQTTNKVPLIFLDVKLLTEK